MKMASRKRGLSVEEKRSRMLDIFYQKKDFFLLKELERIAPKEKGIVSQSVKEVLQSLVDDNLVETDKIGTSVYFWAFPSQATANRKRKLEEVEGKLNDAEQRLKKAKTEVEKAKVGREDTKERQEALKRLISMKAKREELLALIQEYKDSDPEVLESMKKDVEVSRQGINRWTDNIYSLQSWIGKKFPSISISDVRKQFGIPEDLDYV